MHDHGNHRERGHGLGPSAAVVRRPSHHQGHGQRLLNVERHFDFSWDLTGPGTFGAGARQHVIGHD
jgi:hypothetical protein